MIRYLAVVALAFAAGGCTAAQVMRMDTTPRSPKSADAIVFLLERPAKPFTVIAVVTVNDGGWGTDTGKKLRQEAAKLGGDAVFIVDAKESTQSGASYAAGVATAVTTQVKEQTAQIIVFTPGAR